MCKRCEGRGAAARRVNPIQWLELKLLQMDKYLRTLGTLSDLSLAKDVKKLDWTIIILRYWKYGTLTLTLTLTLLHPRQQGRCTLAITYFTLCLSLPDCLPEAEVS